uniref:Uncharacterized protein n=1 Tax=Anopheles epiroticus TaxID=199890 RepID=A0A182PVB3_9DIPT
MVYMITITCMTMLIRPTDMVWVNLMDLSKTNIYMIIRHPIIIRLTIIIRPTIIIRRLISKCFARRTERRNVLVAVSASLQDVVHQNEPFAVHPAGRSDVRSAVLGNLKNDDTPGDVGAPEDDDTPGDVGAPEDDGVPDDNGAPDDDTPDDDSVPDDDGTPDDVGALEDDTPDDA